MLATVYKVVQEIQKEDKKILTGHYPGLAGPYAIEYKIGEWVRPKVGYIFVYKENKFPTIFFENRPNIKVFKAHALNCRAECPVSTYAFDSGNSNLIKQYWDVTGNRCLPSSTYEGICEALKLVEEVEPVTVDVSKWL